VEPFSLDPETALKLIQMLLRWGAYFFAGFAVLGLCTYVVFLCFEIFASQSRAKVRIAKVPQPVSRVSAVEQAHDVVSAETPTPTDKAPVTAGEKLSPV